MYPPNRKRPTAKNTYKNTEKRENTYKQAPKKDETGFNLMLVGAALFGTLLAISSIPPDASASNNEPLPDQPSNPKPQNPTTPKQPTPTPAPAPKPTLPPVVVPAPQSNDIALVVDSWNGEGIFARTKGNYTSDVGYGSEKILHLPNYRYIGAWTGKVENNMLQAHIKINGVSYNVWVDKNEVTKMSIDEYKHHMQVRSVSHKKTDSELRTIVNFFRNRQ
jgi:hypothetical protein